ncbi:hypothetical protein MMC29_000032 [Sticta canariensis]|nr:hypothetical protein [Sticta canariensis]
MVKNGNIKNLRNGTIGVATGFTGPGQDRQHAAREQKQAQPEDGNFNADQWGQRLQKINQE